MEITEYTTIELKRIMKFVESGHIITACSLIKRLARDVNEWDNGDGSFTQYGDPYSIKRILNFQEVK